MQSTSMQPENLSLVVWNCLFHGLMALGSDDGTVKIWSVASQECLKTMGCDFLEKSLIKAERGHSSNVFAVNFLPNNSNQVISGGNDSDIRHYDIESGVCTLFHQHTKKVLKLSVNPCNPVTFLSCSSDGEYFILSFHFLKGSVRFFDLRERYRSSTTKPISSNPLTDDDNDIPQVNGISSVPNFP